MTHPAKLHGAIALALLLSLAAPTAAVAQDNEGDAGQSGSTGTGAESGAASEPVTDAQLEKFAAAYGELQQVRSEYGRKMKQAEEEAKQQELRKEGQQEMVSAIRGEGLKIAEYRRIGQQLNSNEELRSRLQQMMQEQQGGGSGNSG